MRRALVVVGLSVLVLAVVAAVRFGAAGNGPRRVERERIIAAPPEVVLSELGDVHAWAGWSPWQRGAETRGLVYGGSYRGPGASAYWKDERGAETRLTVVGAGADSLDLELEETGRPPADLEFRVAAVEGGTRARLAFVARRNTAARLRAVVGMEDPVGPVLERGLAQLAGAVAARPKVGSFRLERAVTVHAPPEQVLARVSDVRGWEGWSPFEPPGAPVHRSYGGPRKGAGSTMYWSIPATGATGRLTLIRAAASKVELEVEIGGEASDLAMVVASAAGGSLVALEMGGEREAGQAMPEAGATAAELERGLSRLKKLVEGGEHGREAAVRRSRSVKDVRPAVGRGQTATGADAPRGLPASG